MHLDKFDLNLLVAIEALMRRRSVTAAAAELHITQSAMSSALKRARAHFNDDILFYDGQSMTPTPFGSQLESIVPDTIAQLRALSRMRSDSTLAQLNRQFSIIASDYVATVYLSELSRRLAKTAPGISLHVVPFTQAAIQRFKRGVIDFLIAPDFALEPEFGSEILFSDTFQCVLWKDNPVLAKGFTEQDFLSAPQIVTHFFLDDGQSHYERWLVTQKHDFQVAAALPSFVVLPHYIAHTPNIATIHSRLVPHFRAETELVFCAPPVPIPPLHENLITNRKYKHDAEAQLMRDAMLEVGQSLA